MMAPPMVVVVVMMVMIVMVVMMVVVLGQHHWAFRSPLVGRLLGLGFQDIGRVGNRIQQFRE